MTHLEEFYAITLGSTGMNLINRPSLVRCPKCNLIQLVPEDIFPTARCLHCQEALS